MDYHKNAKWYETIPHKTGFVPYSIHDTTVPETETQALYLHWHDELEFFYLISGTLLFYVENDCFLLNAGEGIFIPPGLIHHAIRKTNDPIAFYAFVLSTDVMFTTTDGHLYHTYILPIKHNNLSSVVVLKRDIDWQLKILTYLEQVHAMPTHHELQIIGITYFIWELLYDNHIKMIPITDNLSKLASRIEPAITYISEHYEEEITLANLAKCTFFSVSEFSRQFKLFTGLAPIAYLVRYRIQKSCMALSQTTNTISDIALAHGFNNISYYNRTFAKIIGVTPSVYRARTQTAEAHKNL